MTRKDSDEILKLIEKKLSHKTKKYKEIMKEEFNKIYSQIHKKINEEFNTECIKIRNEIQNINYRYKDTINNLQLEIDNMVSGINGILERLKQECQNIKEFENTLNRFVLEKSIINKEILDTLQKDSRKIWKEIG